MQYALNPRSKKLILRALQERRGKLSRQGEFVNKDEIRESDDLDELIQMFTDMVKVSSQFKD